MATFLDGRVSFLRSSIVLGHDHLVFLNEETGEGLTSNNPDDDHSHRVDFQEAIQEELDEQGNVVVEGQEAQWVMSPGTADGHVHDPIGRDLEFDDEPPEDTREEKQKVIDTKDFFLETLAAERQSRDWAEECRGLYQSNEDTYFDEGNKQKLQAESRPYCLPSPEHSQPQPSDQSF